MKFYFFFNKKIDYYELIKTNKKNKQRNYIIEIFDR